MPTKDSRYGTYGPKYTKTTVPVEAIRTGDRLREDLGDIEDLAESIQTVGLVCPIIVDEDLNLIAGYRRLTAIKAIGWENVDVYVFTGNPKAAEIAENAKRKPFSALEIGNYAIDHWDERGGQSGKTRDILAKAFGISGVHLERCKRIAEHVRNNPGKRLEIEELVEDRGVKHVSSLLRAGALEPAEQPERPAQTLNVRKAESLECGPFGIVASCPSSTWLQDICNGAARVLEPGGLLYVITLPSIVPFAIDAVEQSPIAYTGIIALESKDSPLMVATVAQPLTDTSPSENWRVVRGSTLVKAVALMLEESPKSGRPAADLWSRDGTVRSACRGIPLTVVEP